MTPETPPWQRIIDLFLQHRLPEPPWRLRDELVYHLVNSEKLAAAEKRAAEAEMRFAIKWRDDRDLTEKLAKAVSERASSQASLLRVVEALKQLCDDIEDDQSHGADNFQESCAVCCALKAARTALSPHTEK